MKPSIYVFFSIHLLATATACAAPALTIYNQDFAVVRESIPLELKSGTNQVRFTSATMYVEPSSVILRDPSAKHQFQVLEQNFRAEPVSQELLLALNEGKTIEFEVLSYEAGQARRELVPGKIIRAGYRQHLPGSYGYSTGPEVQPIIEIAGKLRFSLPGQPLFPALSDDTILQPTLMWRIESSKSAAFDAELSYLTGGMRWQADYNLVLPQRGDNVNVVGWVTMENQSGKLFEDARVELMAGDVNKVQNVGGFQRQTGYGYGGGGGGGGAPPVKEKTFDEYHLYTLEHPATLHDQEKKQIEFVRAEGVRTFTHYVYDGARFDPNIIGYGVITEPTFGVASSNKVMVAREFTNSTANHLGLPLPKGQVRFYRRNSDGQVEFIGESLIEHTPRDEVVRVTIGNAFDVVGERTRTDYKSDLLPAGATSIDPTTGLPVRGVRATTGTGPWIDESFEIRIRNHKAEAIEVRIVEHLYRGANWELTKKSDSWKKIEAQTMELPVKVKASGERTVTYTVHYTW